MVEVLFGEGEAGSMKLNKISNTVICLGFMLDVGNIKEPVDSPYRKNLIYSMYSQEQWGKDPDIDNELRKMGDVYVNELARLKKYLKNGKSVRIWYSDSPYSRCGFYYLCKWLQPFNNDVWVVKLPEYIVRGNAIISHHNWGEVAAAEFAEFLQYAKRLSVEEKRMYTDLWNELTDDNSSLRVMINGKVVGTSEDFYDFLIWKRLTNKPIKQARLIGDILGCYPIGVGDWWYARRIEYFIYQEKIKIIEDSENKYGRTISLVK